MVNTLCLSVLRIWRFTLFSLRSLYCFRVVSFILLISHSFPSFAGSDRYTLFTHGGYYSSISEACTSAPVPDASGLPPSWSNFRFTGEYTYVSGILTCQYAFDYDKPDGTPATSGGYSYATVRQLSDCVAGDERTLGVPVGRDNDGEYQDFGSYYADDQCFSGCLASYTGGDGSNESYIIPGAEDKLVYENLIYTLTGSSCSSPTAQPVFTPPGPPEPEDPDEPVDPEQPGGGDTGGGDTGGGDTGGGDTGGGTGGGGTGGGDTGGGDTGGGDTGGGTGGGGTGGGDTGGGDTGGGDTGGDTGGGDGGADDGSVSGGRDCGQSLSCSGDALACELIRQAKAARCADEDFRDLDFDKLQTDLTDQFADDEYQPITADASDILDVSNMIDTSGGHFSRSCPVVPDITFPWFGRAVAIPISTVISPLCQYLVWFGYLVVAFAMRRGAEIIAQGMN